MTLLSSLGHAGFPKIYESGQLKVKEKGEMQYYYVMEKLGMSLKDLIRKRLLKMNLSTVAQIGYQCLLRIQTLHQANYVHGDIKVDNLMVRKGFDPFCIDPNSQKEILYLIDFGISQKITGPLGDHLKKQSKSRFEGNFLFTSFHQF
mmetsp:Transcript_33795/g.32860  ORF Transcript_33795/g.32860 Transcript_33795/m.32860 type:complete len:147 (-) Transcript_33795:1176-1616(-)